jgi:hypothetical protein
MRLENISIACHILVRLMMLCRLVFDCVVMVMVGALRNIGQHRLALDNPLKNTDVLWLSAQPMPRL